MNPITHIKISGYKSIKNLDISLKNINVFLGINGAGKSNLISFFEMLQHINKHQLQNFVLENGGINTLLYNGVKYTKEIDFYINRIDYSFHGRLKVTNNNRLFFAQQGLYDLKNQTNLYASDGFEELKDENLVNQTKILSEIGIYHFHDTSDSSPIKMSCGINDNIELSKDGRNLAAILYRINKTNTLAYNEIIKIIQLVAPYFQDFILRENPLNKNMIQIEWTKKGSDIPFTANQLSDGTLRFICLAVLLLQPKELIKDTLIIDEPELGLHPYAISILGGLIRKLSISKQIILATQSVELINEFETQDIVVVDNKNDFSFFHRLNSDNLANWLEDYTIGELWKKNIIGGRP